MNRGYSFLWTIFLLMVVVSFIMVTLTAAGASEAVSSTDRWRKLQSELGDSAELNSHKFVAPVEKAVQLSQRKNLADSAGEECPIDLSDLSDVRFAITDTCSISPPPMETADNAWPPVSVDTCCNVVLTGYAILQAQWTQTSHMFRVENEAVLRSCVKRYVRGIEDFGTGLQVETCFSDSFYKYSNRDPSLCGPKTVEEYEALVGISTLAVVRAACNADLLESQDCGVCCALSWQLLEKVSQLAENNNVTLNIPDGNVTDLSSAKSYDCIYDTVTYIAAVLLEKGPADLGSQTCLYVMPLPPSGSGKKPAGLIPGVADAGVFNTYLLKAPL